MEAAPPLVVEALRLEEVHLPRLHQARPRNLRLRQPLVPHQVLSQLPRLRLVLRLLLHLLLHHPRVLRLLLVLRQRLAQHLRLHPHHLLRLLQRLHQYPHQRLRQSQAQHQAPVSYTHLTLPTKRIV